MPRDSSPVPVPSSPVPCHFTVPANRHGAFSPKDFSLELACQVLNPRLPPGDN
jgi:hypothetical protein